MMQVALELWLVRESLNLPPGSASCMARWEEDIDDPSINGLRGVMESMLSAGVDVPGIWTLRLCTADLRMWLCHYRVVETDEGLDLADELFESKQVNVTRWPPKS